MGDPVFFGFGCFYRDFKIPAFLSPEDFHMPSCSRLLVASAKGGVGKSTTALGLAAAFAEMKKRVLLVDLDITSRSLDMLTGASDMTVRDIADLLTPASRDTDIRSVCTQPVEKLPDLSFIAACSPERLSELAGRYRKTEEMLLREAVVRILEWGEFDLLICDTGGGCDIPAAVADLFDFTAIVSEQSLTSIRAAEYAAARLERAGAVQMRLVICGFDLTSVRREKRAGVIEMIDRCALPCLGVVPYDRKLQKAQDNGRLPDAASLSAAAYANIAGRLSGKETPLFSGMGALYRRRALAL